MGPYINTLSSNTTHTKIIDIISSSHSNVLSAFKLLHIIMFLYFNDIFFMTINIFN